MLLYYIIFEIFTHVLRKICSSLLQNLVGLSFKLRGSEKFKLFGVDSKKCPPVGCSLRIPSFFNSIKPSFVETNCSSSLLKWDILWNWIIWIQSKYYKKFSLGAWVLIRLLLTLIHSLDLLQIVLRRKCTVKY